MNRRKFLKLAAFVVAIPKAGFDVFRDTGRRVGEKIGLISEREELSDIIYNIKPIDNPFLEYIKRENER